MKQPELLKFYTSASGSYRNVHFIGVKGDNIIVKGKKKNVEHPLSLFQPGTVEFAKQYSNHAAELRLEKELNTLKEGFSSPEPEEWISAEGKTVTAQYEKLEGETLHLVVKKKGYTDRNFKLSLEKLDTASQEKAKKWQSTLEKQDEQVEALKAKLAL